MDVYFRIFTPDLTCMLYQMFVSLQCEMQRASQVGHKLFLIKSNLTKLNINSVER